MKWRLKLYREEQFLMEVAIEFHVAGKLYIDQSVSQLMKLSFCHLGNSAIFMQNSKYCFLALLWYFCDFSPFTSVRGLCRWAEWC